MNIQLSLAEALSPLVGLSAERLQKLFEVPPNVKLGDLALPCFPLSREWRKSPLVIARELADAVSERLSDRSQDEAAGMPFRLLSRVVAINGYLNLYYNRVEYTSAILDEIEAEGAQYGASHMGQGKRVLIEFSSPNIAKPFHVGHLCSTVIGNALASIYGHLGYETLKINHLGDWGTQFGKLMVAWRRWGDNEAIEKTPIREMLRVYVKFHETAQQQPSLEEEARQWFKRLEDADPDAHSMWERFMQLSLVEFERIYQALGIRFDYVQGESFYKDKMAEVREMLEEKNLLITSDGARVVSLEDEGMPPCLVVKSDGASTYATRDLAAAIYRKRTYGFDKCLYVVGTPQALHFQQVFSVLKRMDMGWHADCRLVGFGLVRFADRKLSTRTGDVVFLEEVLDEAVKRCAAKMKEKVADTEQGESDETARMVGIGAVVYAFLKNGRDRDIVFSWEDSLDFDGDSGPYVQYAHARAVSILRKQPDGAVRRVGEKQADMPVHVLGNHQTDLPGIVEVPLTHDLEFQLAKHLDGFKHAVWEAAERNEPCFVARQIALIARTFNRFYAACPIQSASPDIRKSRLRLTTSVCQVLKIGMGLLGIGVPESM